MQISDSIYFGDENGNVYLCEPGKPKPRLIAKAECWINCMTLLDEKLYFGSDDGLYVYEPRTAECKKVAKNAKVVSLAVLGDILYCGTESSGLYSYDPKHPGRKLGRATKLRCNVSTIVALGECMYFGSRYYGSVFSYNPVNHKTKRVAQAKGELKGMSQLDGNLYYCSDTYATNYVYAYDPATKKQRKETWFSNFGCMAARDGVLYIGTNNLYSYDPETGEKIQLAESGCQIMYIAPLDERVYFGTRDGCICSYDFGTKRQKEVASVGASVTCVLAEHAKAH